MHIKLSILFYRGFIKKKELIIIVVVDIVKELLDH